MPGRSHLHQLFCANTCHAYIHTLCGKIARSTAPVARATTSVRGGITTTGPG